MTKPKSILALQNVRNGQEEVKS